MAMMKSTPMIRRVKWAEAEAEVEVKVENVPQKKINVEDHLPEIYLKTFLMEIVRQTGRVSHLEKFSVL
jgi:hypothetical protein